MSIVERSVKLIRPLLRQAGAVFKLGKAPRIVAELFFFCRSGKFDPWPLGPSQDLKKEKRGARETGPAHPLAGERPGAPSGGRKKEKEERRKKGPKGRQAKG